MPAAFFDLDKTLIRPNSGRLWFQRERKDGRLRLRHAVEATLWISLYGIGLTGAHHAIARAVRVLAGEAEDELAARTRSFWDQELADTVLPGGLAALQRHREAGDTLVLLTSSSIYLARCAGQAMGIDHLLASRFEVRDGRFTGAVCAPLCYGAGKVANARQWADEHGERLEDATFYTDSYSDLPMLDAVGHPVVVRPDPRLARLAKKRGWPMHTWEAEPIQEAARAGA